MSDSDTPTEPAPPLTADESVYDRDEDGELLPIERTIQTSLGPRQVAYEPTPIGEANRLQRQFAAKDELDIDELDGLLNDKVIEPELDWSDPDIRPGVYNPVLDGLLDLLLGEVPTNEFHREVREELERRAESGNSD